MNTYFLKNSLTLLILLGVLGFSSSCNLEIPEEATLNIEGLHAESVDDFDYEYGDAIQNGFRDYSVQENNQGFYLDMSQNQGFQIPKSRPRQHPALVGRLMGRTIDGGLVYYTPGYSNSWYFSTSLSTLANMVSGNKALIGIFTNGVPIYLVVNETPYDEFESDLDSYGGSYDNTQDFPAGVYHYQLTFNAY